MKGLKKVTAVLFLATIMCMGATVASAGSAEAPGTPIVVTDVSDDSATVAGTAESPGFFELALVYMATLIL